MLATFSLLRSSNSRRSRDGRLMVCLSIDTALHVRLHCASPSMPHVGVRQPVPCPPFTADELAWPSGAAPGEPCAGGLRPRRGERPPDRGQGTADPARLEGGCLVRGGAPRRAWQPSRSRAPCRRGASVLRAFLCPSSAL